MITDNRVFCKWCRKSSTEGEAHVKCQDVVDSFQADSKVSSPSIDLKILSFEINQNNVTPFFQDPNGEFTRVRRITVKAIFDSAAYERFVLGEETEIDFKQHLQDGSELKVRFQVTTIKYSHRVGELEIMEVQGDVKEISVWT